MLIQYKEFNFKAASMETIDQANAILNSYRDQGYRLTLRQLYYQFVSRDLIPNNERSYKNLGGLISNARVAGLISWHDIEDRTRTTTRYSFEEDETEAVYGAEYGIRYDYWERQDFYVEVWIEKEALFNVIQRPCERFRVPHLACKGYLSQSEAWTAGQRFKEATENGKECILLHLGDH